MGDFTDFSRRHSNRRRVFFKPALLRSRASRVQEEAPAVPIFTNLTRRLRFAVTSVVWRSFFGLGNNCSFPPSTLPGSLVVGFVMWSRSGVVRRTKSGQDLENWIMGNGPPPALCCSVSLATPLPQSDPNAETPSKELFGSTAGPQWSIM